VEHLGKGERSRRAPDLWISGHAAGFVYRDSAGEVPGSVDGLPQACAIPFSGGLARKIRTKENVMLRWALIFLIVAVVAGIFGFAGIMIAAAGIAKLLFYLFLLLFLVSLVMGLVSRT
jgi:uncharacterized membrane protein YtjA (UPF0391 family)